MYTAKEIDDNSIINLRPSLSHRNRTESDFWYGEVCQSDNKGKSFTFSVSNHLDPNKKYKWRYVSMCRAGFITIFDNESSTPVEMCYYLSKGNKNVQVWKETTNDDGTIHGLWVNVITFKSGRFYSVDKSILESLTVGNMHDSFPKMLDYNLLKVVGATNHLHLAYRSNR